MSDRTLGHLEDTITQELPCITDRQAWLNLANALGPQRKTSLTVPAWARRGLEGHFYMIQATVLPSLVQHPKHRWL